MKMTSAAFHDFFSTVDAKVQSDLAKFATILVLVLVLVNFRHDNLQCGAVREEGICGKTSGVEITRSGELLGLIPTCSSRTRQRLIQETPLATSHLWWGSQDIRKADTKSTETRGAHS